MNSSDTPLPTAVAVAQAPAPQVPAIPLETFLSLISAPIRWRILCALAAGEELLLSEITEAVGSYTDLVSKHLKYLREAGMVVSQRRLLYKVPAHYRPVPGARLLDFGHCVMRAEMPAAA